MRLTLRTLLAYLDSILEPNDSQDLGKKIEESEFATSLVHRIRDVMRRLRLGAPSLTDRGPGLDPNTVAEYLDNTLATDRVTDFEKVCLDSDVHLAEVASCHQILTLVLGEPAEVDAASRERIYNLKDLPAEAASSHAPPALPPTPAMPTSAAPSLDLEGDGEPARRQARPKPTVPEYLREPRKRPAWLAVAAAAVLAVCLTVVVVFMLGLLDPGTPLGDMLVRLGVRTDSRQVAAQTDAKGEGRGETQTEPSDKLAAEAAKGPANEPPVAEATSKPPAELAKQPGGEPPKQPPASVPPGAAAPPQTETAPRPEAEKPPVGARKEAETPPVTVPKLPHKSTTPPEAKPPAAPDDTARRAPPVERGRVGGEAGKTPAAKPEGELPPLSPEPLGRLMSSEQVLLGADAAGDWTRVGPNQVLVPQQLLVLPTYRAKVALTVGITLEILGPARVELLGSSRHALPGIRVRYGRVVLMPLGKAGARLQVAFGDHTGMITFADADSTAALDVRRLRAPGTNPESGPSRIAADLYVTTGGISWEETVDGKGGEPLQLAPLQRLSFDAQVTLTPKTVKELPKWITAEPIRFLDRKASAAIAQALKTDRPARVGLLELATSRPQKEVKWLALRCLGCVGQFRDMVAALNEPVHKLDWADYYIDELRAAVGRDVETAAAVRLALEQQYPQQAATLYRMLWGYSNQDLEAGEDAKLVQGLKDEETLAVRVLAIWNLKDITGLGQLYQPEQTAAKRQMATRRWEERLAAKEIRFKTPEEKASARPGERSRPLGPGAVP